MSNKNAFIIPKGLDFIHEDDGLTIEYEHDIILQSHLGPNITKLVSKTGNIHIDIELDIDTLAAPKGKIFLNKPIRANSITGNHLESKSDLQSEELQLSGSLQVLGAVEVNTLEIDGTAQVNGSINAETIRIHGNTRINGSLDTQTCFFGSDIQVHGDVKAERIESQGSFRSKGSLKAHTVIVDKAKIILEKDVELNLLRGLNISLKGWNNKIIAIQAHQNVSIVEGVLNSDVLVAKQVEIHPSTMGKIMVVDVEKPLGPHSIKGCLSPEDLAPLLPDPAAFMRQRGIVFHKGNDAEEVAEEEQNHSPPDEDSSSESEEATEQLSPAADNPSFSMPDSVDDFLSMPSEKAEKEDNDTDSEPEPEKTDIWEIATLVRKEDAKADLEENTQDEPETSVTLSGNIIVEDLAKQLSVKPSEVIKELLNLNIMRAPKDPIPFEVASMIAQFFGATVIDERSPDVSAPDADEDSNSESSEEEVSEDVTDTASADKAVIVLHSSSTATPKEENEKEVEFEDFDDMQPMDEIPSIASSNADSLHEQFQGLAKDILSSYDGNAPDSIQSLDQLIEEKNYPLLKEEIKLIWGQLLRFHQKLNTRIPAKVIVAFNEINRLLLKI